MRQGENWWRRLSLNRGESRSRPEDRPRRPQAFRPDGAGAALECRKLLSVAHAKVHAVNPSTAAPNLKDVTTFEAPSVVETSQDVATGPDGYLWFTEPGIGKVGKISPSGAVAEFPLPAGHVANGGITAGPDGNVWFTEGDSVGRITPGGYVTEFPVGPGAHLTGITAGPDGNVWFMNTDQHKVGRVTPDGAVTEFPIPAATAIKSADLVNFFHDITAGPDGNVWYTAELVNHKAGTQVGEIGRVTPDGGVTVFKLPAGRGAHKTPFSFSKTIAKGGVLADAITAGPDGNVWFTEHQSGGPAGVGRITPEGKITHYPIPATPRARPPDVALSIATGSDHNLWFNLAEDNFARGPRPAPYVGRITPSGQVSIFSIPNVKDAQAAQLGDGAETIVSGPDGNLWFTSTTHRYTSSTGRVIGAFPPQSQ